MQNQIASASRASRARASAPSRSAPARAAAAAASTTQPSPPHAVSRVHHLDPPLLTMLVDQRLAAPAAPTVPEMPPARWIESTSLPAASSGR